MIVSDKVDLDGLDDLGKSLRKRLKKAIKKVTAPIKKVAKKVGAAVQKTAKKVGTAVKKTSKRIGVKAQEIHKKVVKITKRLDPVQIYRAKRKAAHSSGGDVYEEPSAEEVIDSGPSEPYDPSAYAPVPGESYGAPDYDGDGYADEQKYDDEGNPIPAPSTVPAPVPTSTTIAPTSMVGGIPMWILITGGVALAGGAYWWYLKKKGKI